MMASASPTETVHGQPPTSLWRSVLEALRGSHQDYTAGDLNRSILLLAIPMVLEMVLESLFAVVDVFFVGRLGANAIATVGLTESVLTLVFAVGMGLGMSTTAMVARRIGEKDANGAAVAAVQAIVIGMVASVVMGIPFFVFAPQLLRLMGASPAIIATGGSYTRIALGGSGVVLLLFLNNAIFRGTGDAALAMRLLWVSNILNLILDPCLIFGLGPFPRLGVTGAALATFSGRGIGVLYQFYRLSRGTERLHILARHVRLQADVMWRLIRVSVSGILQFLIGQASWLGLVRIVSLFGASALAGYTIAIRIVIFYILPSWGLSNAAATLVGQNLGAGHPQRARSAVLRTGLWNLVFQGLVGVGFILFAPQIIPMFSQSPAVIKVAVDCLRIFCCGNMAFAYGMVLLQAFNGAGDTLTPTYVNLFGFWVVEIPLAWWLAMHTHLQVNGVFVSVVVAQTVIVLISLVLFRRGRWARQRI